MMISEDEHDRRMLILRGVNIDNILTVPGLRAGSAFHVLCEIYYKTVFNPGRFELTEECASKCSLHRRTLKKYLKFWLERKAIKMEVIKIKDPCDNEWNQEHYTIDWDAVRELGLISKTPDPNLPPKKPRTKPDPDRPKPSPPPPSPSEQAQDLFKLQQRPTNRGDLPR